MKLILVNHKYVFNHNPKCVIKFLTCEKVLKTVTLVLLYLIKGNNC